MLTLLQERVWDFVIRVLNFEITLKIKKVFVMRNSKLESFVTIKLQTQLNNNLEVISLIRSAPDAEAAKKSLTSKAWPVLEVEQSIKLIDDPQHFVKEGKYFYKSQTLFSLYLLINFLLFELVPNV